MDVTRRNLIQILSAAPAVAAAQTQAEHAHAAPAAPAKKRIPAQDLQRSSVADRAGALRSDHSRRRALAAAPPPPAYPSSSTTGSTSARTRMATDNFAAGVLGGLAWLDSESTRLFQKDFAAAAPDAAEADSGPHRLARPRRRGGPPVGRLLHPLPRSHGQRLLLQQDGRRGSAVPRK